MLENGDFEIGWGDFLSVGIAEMDDEHRQFIARVNELNKAIVGVEDKATVARAMDLMMLEAARHFAHEEELLARCNYPEAAAHAAKHAELSAQIKRVMKEFAEADISFVWAIKGLRLKQLLVGHLLDDDMKYRDHLPAQQMTRAVAAAEKKPVAFVETPPARRRDSKGGGGETPRMNSTIRNCAAQQFFWQRPNQWGTSSAFLIASIR